MKDCRDCKLFSMEDLMTGDGCCEFHQKFVNIYDKACEDILDIASDMDVGGKSQLNENQE